MSNTNPPERSDLDEEELIVIDQEDLDAVAFESHASGVDLPEHEVDFTAMRTSVAAREAAYLQASQVMIHPRAREIVSERSLMDRLRECKLLIGAGRLSMQELFNRAQFARADSGAEVIKPGGEVKGLLIPTSRVNLKIMEGEVTVAKRTLGPGDYIGEALFLGNRKPTATVVNESGETNFIYLTREDFLVLSPATRQLILEGAIRNHPLLNMQRKVDTAIEQGGWSEPYAIFGERKGVPIIIDSLLRKQREGFASGNFFRPIFSRKYVKGDKIESEPGYLAFIVQGAVTVNQVLQGERFGITKKAEIHENNTIFEGSALGIEPPEDTHVIVDSGDLQILWVAMDRDHPRYEDMLCAACDSLNWKLEEANKREALLRAH